MLHQAFQKALYLPADLESESSLWRLSSDLRATEAMVFVNVSYEVLEEVNRQSDVGQAMP